MTDKPLTRAEIAEMLERCEKARPGPWYWSIYCDSPQLNGNIKNAEECPILVTHVCDACRKRGARCMSASVADEEHITAARTDHPRALRHLDALLEAVHDERDLPVILALQRGDYAARLNAIDEYRAALLKRVAEKMEAEHD